jgi:pimeloyl-ACP methyl ester carboxylesterase
MYPARERGITARHITLKGGLKIRVIESGAENDEAVVLVHGWGSCVYTFAEMLPALVAARYRVIAFDLPGHGLSDKPNDDSVYSTRALSDVVLEVASALGIRQFTIVGHSMGGLLALDLATRGERRVERIVLVNSVGLGSAPILLPAKLFTPRLIDRITPALLTRTTVSWILRIAFGTPERPTDRDVDEYWAPTQFDEYAWACRACLHHVSWERIAATKLRSLRLPVLVIIGGRDVLVRGAATRARLIPGARIVTVPRGGHLVLQECATQTNAELVSFLRGRRKTR